MVPCSQEQTEEASGSEASSLCLHCVLNRASVVYSELLDTNLASPLNGTAADGRQRSGPRSESLQRFAEATIALRTRSAKEANRVASMQSLGLVLVRNN